MASDLLSNELIKIKNAFRVKKENVVLKLNKTILGVLNVLLDNGYIEGFEIKDDERNFKKAVVKLKKDAIVEFKQISKPGQRIYSNVKNMPKPYNGLGTCIMSTNKGIMSDKQARKNNSGGEVICVVF